MERPTIAGSSGTHGQSLLRLGSALEELTGQPPKIKEMVGLAGPNETVQLLMSGATWLGFLYLTKPFFDAFLSKLGTESAARLLRIFEKAPPVEASPKLGPAAAVAGSLADAHRFGNSVIIGLPIEAISKSRHLGIEVTYSEPGLYEGLANAIVAMAQIGSAIEEEFAKAQALGLEPQPHRTNSDMSGKIDLHDDGSTSVEISVLSADRRTRTIITLRFDENGRRLENDPMMGRLGTHGSTVFTT